MTTVRREMIWLILTLAIVAAAIAATHESLSYHSTEGGPASGRPVSAIPSYSPAPDVLTVAGSGVHPEGLAAKMAARYASLKSYSDAGVVHDIASGKDHIRFKTYFERPDHIRFEWSEQNFDGGYEDYFLCGSDREVFSWFLGKVVAERSVDMAVAGATGVSRGSAHDIPRMLMPDRVSGLSLARLQFDAQVYENTFRSTACWVIRGKHPTMPAFYRLWIGRQDLLLHRIINEQDDEMIDTIQVNRPMTADYFIFNPPTSR